MRKASGKPEHALQRPVIACVNYDRPLRECSVSCRHLTQSVAFEKAQPVCSSVASRADHLPRRSDLRPWSWTLPSWGPWEAPWRISSNLRSAACVRSTSLLTMRMAPASLPHVWCRPCAAHGPVFCLLTSQRIRRQYLLCLRPEDTRRCCWRCSSLTEEACSPCTIWAVCVFRVHLAAVSGR